MRGGHQQRWRPHAWPRPAVRFGVALAALALLAAAFSSGTSGAETGPPPLTVQPAIGAPESTVLIGSSPAEAGGETWGYATSGGFSILRYTDTTGVWETYPPALDDSGQRLEGFVPSPGPFAGSATSGGGVAIVGHDAEKAEQMLIRDPGGPFHETPAPSSGSTAAQPDPPLRKGETLTNGGEGVLLAAVEQPSGHTGALLVPFESANGVQDGVLFYDGSSWSREPICEGVGGGPCRAPTSGFSVLAIGATSTQNAWLLAKTAGNSEGIALFSREATGEGPPRWRQRSLGASPFAHSEATLGEAHVRVAALSGQPLTVTEQGVWVDGTLTFSMGGAASQNTTFTLFYEPSASAVAASWCEVPGAFASAATASLCRYPLGAQLPSGPHRSFAWSSGGAYGSRVITGLGDGVSLSLSGEKFERLLGLGGEGGQSSGAAFSSPEEGWLAEQGPLTHLTRNPAPDLLQPWPVPFRRPLTAIAEQPGATSGELGAQALAVGDHGQVARYVPGRGWTPEALLDSEGHAQTPELRGVAWPTPNHAFAVGTENAMWTWRAETGLWEPDPARPPDLELANFTGIAFDPTEPQRGYAIGQQGLLLRYGKSWTPEALPAGLEHADLTSIAFAGDEALVTYQIPHFGPNTSYSGGLLVNDGSGWRVDTGAAEAMGDAVPMRVAGLPDGGAAVACAAGQVFLRQNAQAAWQPAPAGPLGQTPVALAAFREGATLRAAVSVEETPGASLRGYVGGESSVDGVLETEPPAGQAPRATGAYPLPATGYLLRETPNNGWSDQEHQDYPPPGRSSQGADWPYVPDAVLALALAPEGSQGWAVGGQTGELNQNVQGEYREAIQTSGVMRVLSSPTSGAAPTGFSAAPVATSTGNASFAFGGDAQCAAACADLAGDQLGPDVWLTNAIARSAQTPGVRAFLYTGLHLASGIASTSGAAGFQREVEGYARLLAGAGGPPAGAGAPGAVFAAPSATDLNAEGTLGAFGSAFSALAAPQGSAPAPPGVTPISAASPQSGAYYYSFESTGATGGPVRVIVLDYSNATLAATQQCWLATQLALAGKAERPSIVMGSRGIDAGEENPAGDAASVAPILVAGAPPPGCITGMRPAGASAYFYDSAGANRVFQISAGGASIPEFGSGTLGYVSTPNENSFNFVSASGFLLAEVETAKRNPATNRAPVSTRLIPDISDLAIDAENGVLLRRSQDALFSALARRPRAGMFCIELSGACNFQPDPYVPIPSNCTGSACATGIQPYYTFASASTDIGEFVEPDPASPEGTTVLQNSKGEPIPDEPRNSKGELTPSGQFEKNSKGEPINERGEVISTQSGLFCAYNAGTTIVTVQTGGLASAEQVTVQPGSVEQPCGTVRLHNPPRPAEQASLPAPVPAPAPTPAASPRGTLPPPPAAPLAAPVLVPHIAPHPVPAPLSPPPVPAQLYPLVALVPPPAPAAARPTPPSGTAQVPAQSPVSQPVAVAEHEREEEGATEMVHHMAAFEHRPTEAPLPSWPIALVLVAAAAGAGLRRPRAQLARASSGRAR